MGNQSFPIVEAFGYHWDAKSQAASAARAAKMCPFSQVPCEKYRQYRFGYCSVTYAAADDEKSEYTYAVCDHRLDGPPLHFVLQDFFASRPATMVSEIVLTDPRQSFDYVAFDKNDVNNLIAIETQAVDLRGGGVGPAWRALEEGKVDIWRSYFTREAKQKNRKDNVAYGVNMANIYKRLGLQVAAKGQFLREIGIPFYVLMQDRTFDYLRKRIRFPDAKDKWDVSFVTFDYTRAVLGDGSLEFKHFKTVRTTIDGYVDAMSKDRQLAVSARDEFINRVKRKAGLP